MDFETRVVVRVILVLLPFFIVIGRLIWITPSTHSIVDVPHDTLLDSSIGSNIMIFLGSGGHTGEMMKLLHNIDLAKLSRTWVITSSDTTSMLKCKEFEDLLHSEFPATFLSIHRARLVGEPMLSSVKNTLISFYDSFSQIYHLPTLPSVLLINGPGTSVPIAYILFLLKFAGIGHTSIIYVESLARVNDLSVSGKLLLPITDRFIVQWPQLALKYKRAEYHGILV